MSKIGWDLVINTITLVFVIIGGIVGTVQYFKSQKWKRAEFLADKHRDFTENLYVQKAMRMFDGFTVYISVDKNEYDGINEFIDFKPELLIKAMTPVNEGTLRGKEEVHIRLCIDKFLFRFGNFHSYLENKLVDKIQIENMLGYWIKAIGDPNDKTIDQTTKALLWNYIKDYNYNSAHRLLTTFGYNI